MGFDYYSDYYHMGLFTKENLDLFVEVAMLSAEDEAKILAEKQLTLSRLRKAQYLLGRLLEGSEQNQENGFKDQ